jgi:hypothetical protein
MLEKSEQEEFLVVKLRGILRLRAKRIVDFGLVFQVKENFDSILFLMSF